MLLGSNLAETMPPSVQHLAEVRSRGGLVVVDPRRSATAALTAPSGVSEPGTGLASPGSDRSPGGGIHLQPVPGTDLVVLLALLHVVWAEGLADEDYLTTRVDGAQEVRRAVAAWWPERAESVCGVAADELRRVARLLAAASPSRGGRGAYVLTGRGVEQSTQGTATVTAAINLALALGLPGGAGPGTARSPGRATARAGASTGRRPTSSRATARSTTRRASSRRRGVGSGPSSLPGPGMPAVELLHSLGTPGGPRALLVHGSNVLVSAPNAGKVAERLDALDLLVVCDMVPSETALRADVVLPVTQWAEEEGTMTSLEGRVIRRRQAVAAPEGVQSELWIFAELARRLGSPVSFPVDPAEVFDELARASAGGVADYSGLSHARLDADEAVGGPGLFWPVRLRPCPPSRCPPSRCQNQRGLEATLVLTALAGSAAPGTPRLFLDRFLTPTVERA
ncbi:molybdopterin-dependent oxidoreductase [Oerskovia sp. M15]